MAVHTPKGHLLWEEGTAQAKTALSGKKDKYNYLHSQNLTNMGRNLCQPSVVNMSNARSVICGKSGVMGLLISAQSAVAASLFWNAKWRCGSHVAAQFRKRQKRKGCRQRLRRYKMVTLSVVSEEEDKHLFLSQTTFFFPRLSISGYTSKQKRDKSVTERLTHWL